MFILLNSCYSRNILFCFLCLCLLLSVTRRVMTLTDNVLVKFLDYFGLFLTNLIHYNKKNGA